MVETFIKYMKYLLINYENLTNEHINYNGECPYFYYSEDAFIIFKNFLLIYPELNHIEILKDLDRTKFFSIEHKYIDVLKNINILL